METRQLRRPAFFSAVDDAPGSAPERGRRCLPTYSITIQGGQSLGILAGQDRRFHATHSKGRAYEQSYGTPTFGGQSIVVPQQFKFSNTACGYTRT